jgi:protein gp37
MDFRYGRVKWGSGQKRVRTSIDNWKEPLRWNRAATTAGVRERVFYASLADVFDGESPEDLDAWRADLWELIRKTPQLDWLLLTKRPGNVLRMVPWKDGRPPNVWIGTSVENQAYARNRLPVLSEIPAAVRFVSAEPLLEAFDLKDYAADWVIAGGESGNHYRPFNAEDVRSLQ